MWGGGASAGAGGGSGLAGPREGEQCGPGGAGAGSPGRSTVCLAAGRRLPVWGQRKSEEYPFAVRPCVAVTACPPASPAGETSGSRGGSARGRAWARSPRALCPSSLSAFGGKTGLQTSK